MEDKFIVHDRVGVQGEYVPVDESSFLDIPEEYTNDLDSIQKYSEELYDARLELGRLIQVMFNKELKDNPIELGRLFQISLHLVNVCNTMETNLTSAKENIIIGMGLEEGNWAIDFSRTPRQVGKVLPVDKKIPRVA